jgi:hypothetical protein
VELGVEGSFSIDLRLVETRTHTVATVVRYGGGRADYAVLASSPACEEAGDGR